jgi:hypothetical protein
MKKLFILVLLPLLANAAPAKKKPEPAAAAVSAPAPAPVKERKPGFWERAWSSTKKGTSAVGHAVVHPFGGSKKSKTGEAQVGWHDLAMSLVIDPAQVKLPDTRAVRVLFSVANKGKTAAQLDFPTTQRIEVLLKTDDGKTLSKWSEDQKVEAEQGFLVINPEERLEYSATVSTREMKPGNTYVIEAYFPNFDQLRASKTLMPVK